MTYDAVVVGTGPNGLASAITLARADHSALVLEAKDTIGGGTHSAELTLPGFVHDVCSAIHPLGVASPFFWDLPLEQYGLGWVFPLAAVAHPFDDGTAAVLVRSIEATGETLGRDAAAYQRLMEPLVDGWERLAVDLLGPFPLPPRRPLALARFGLRAVRSAQGLAERTFAGKRTRALFAGLAAHSMLPPDRPISAAFGLVLGIIAHSAGWSMARGGAQQIANTLTAHLRSLGGEVVTGTGGPVRRNTTPVAPDRR
jgi:phytoene dehydrogenase-like protein